MSPVLAEQSVQVQGSADRKTMLIGDRLEYTLTFSHPARLALTPPEKKTELGAWEIKDRRLTTGTKEPAVTRLQYTLTTFTTGEVLIPGTTFTFTEPGRPAQEVASSPLLITVESLLAKTGDIGDIRDIKPPLSLPVPLSTYLWWLAACAAAGVIAWRYARSRHRAPAAPETAAPAVPPMARALEELEKLKNSGLVAEGRVKEFYVSLYDIIRVYIGAVYSLETLDKTSGEILRQFRARETDKKTVVAVRDFFEACDLVKFAKHRPEEKTCWQDWETAKKIVEG